MIGYKRPLAPKEYFSDTKISDARVKIRNIISSDPSALKAEDFPNAWRTYRNYFSDAQGSGKCAYCESRIKPTAKGDLDHFRPKTEILEYKDQGRRKSSPRQKDRKRQGKISTKPGYWWLAYSWSNWVLACSSCNSEWKGSQFPRKITQFFGESELIEECLIINPFDCADVHNHFEFKLDGDITPLTKQGEHTVKCCGLDRWDLVGERARMIELYLGCLLDFQLAREENILQLANSALLRVANMCDADAAYAGMIRYLVDSQLDFKFNWQEIVYMRDGGALAGA